MNFNAVAILAFALPASSGSDAFGRDSLPSCYEFNVSWVNSTLDDFIFPVNDASQCQKLCKDSKNCTAWTWTTQNNHEIKDACTLFSSIGNQEHFPETISGPRSCVCSENKACSASEDNVIRIEENVEIEETCQDFCFNTTGCQWYTWFDSSEFLSHICILLSECDDPYSDCSGCYSGPPDCDPEPQEEVAIVVTGGDYVESNYKAEALNQNGSRLCLLPDLTTAREFHSMSGGMVCGGGSNSYSRRSCTKFKDGIWEEFPAILLELRGWGISWSRPDGKIRLLGGTYSPSSSEMVSESGSVAGFPMKYITESACGIEFADQIIVTGGLYTRNTVSIYNDDGWVEDLAPLKTGRRFHACAHYTSDNDLMYIVAGGFDSSSNTVSSTEVYSSLTMEWNYGVPLPHAIRFYSNGISLHNNVFLLGGREDEIYSDVLKLDEENNQWIKVGDMSRPRVGHASSVMPLKDVKPFCVPEQKSQADGFKQEPLSDEDSLTYVN